MGIMNKTTFDVYLKFDEKGQYFCAELNGHKYAKRVENNGIPIELQCDEFARECLKAEKIEKPEDFIIPEKEPDFSEFMFNKMTRI